MTEQEQVLMSHTGAAYNLARWLTLSGPDAEDVVQESILNALRALPGFHGSNARAWLMAIVRNACYDWMKAKTPPPENLVAESPEDAIVAKDEVNQALQKLPPDFREVIVLRELEGMSYKEIAEITGVPAGTVMSRLSRARGQLRQALTLAA